jgi:hypothetical protein
MSEFKVNHLLATDTVKIRDVLCDGSCRHRGPEERASETQLVFPYRGIYVRHIGREQAVADANHVLLFNAGEAYQISHPVNGGDASLVVVKRHWASAASSSESIPAPRHWWRFCGTRSITIRSSRWRPRVYR